MLRFLCIDDDRDYLANIKYYIAEYGIQVSISDGFAVCDEIELDQEPYDLVVINGEMLLALDKSGLSSVMQWCSYAPLVIVHDGHADDYGLGFEKVVAFLNRSESYGRTASRLVAEARTSAGLESSLRAG